MIQTLKQHAYLIKLLGFDFIVTYKLDKSNLAMDALSRQFQGEQQEKIHTHPGFALRDQLLFYHNKLVVLRDKELRQQLLIEFHSSPLGGHGGIRKSMSRLSLNFYWQGLACDVQEFVQKNHVCQQAKYQARAPVGLLQPLLVPNQIWEEVALDFVTRLPKSAGYFVIFVVGATQKGTYSCGGGNANFEHGIQTTWTPKINSK
ncbi:hypothetical protein Patl1_15363 [Pistacia atlantica]|uniref:Uncharacterized protein n=1 Tax=Pistacia atlantica TaxID=434234 RepID=A0ACC1BAU9_9ROSI|nr:hypothetical protein Patl1_15363 [Pistacia atlantica]